VSHDLKTVHRVADRIIMLYPLARLEPEEAQVIFDGDRQALEQCGDERVRQFVEGKASPIQVGEV
jgi:phospholipid/cholesterol/gamma-HCH transport system ATP-binding protein